MAQILTSKDYIESLYRELKIGISELPTTPCLTIVTVGDDPASKVYVRNKFKAAEKIGMIAHQIVYPDTVTQEELEKGISELAADDAIDGIILQLPVPKHLNVERLQNAIPANKDVDGFRLDSPFYPCTPLGCMALLRHYDIEVAGKHCVVIGRSKIVGKPLARLLLDANATVTVCHSKTSHDDLVTACRTADIIFAASGVKNLVTNEMITPETVLVDISINRNDEGKLCGDADPSIYDTIAAYTPVPGGIGPMTVAMLMWNTYQARYVKTQKQLNAIEGMIL